MNKLAQYLNQHLVGEVVVDSNVLERFSFDNSPLKITPEMVAYPRSTNDIRKLLRFSWQLAEKGHKLPVTPRGAGMDTTGGAIGSGLVISLGSHMNRIFEYDAKQRLVRLQPGVSQASLKNALALQGSQISALDSNEGTATLGGIVAAKLYQDNAPEWIEQLEVVLANGDILQTKRLSKRELNKKKGEQSFEGDIYRGVDNLIDDNQQLIDQLDESDAVGYTALRQVKRKDGSFDLAPLFYASQGTLGVISEMILKAEIAAPNRSVVTATFDDAQKARDALDGVEKIGPRSLEYFDSQMVRQAQASGKTFSAIEKGVEKKTVFIVTCDDVSTRVQARKVKKLTKLFEQFGAAVNSTDHLEESDQASIVSLATLALQVSNRDDASIPLVDGVFVPLERFDEFADGVAELATKRRVTLPLYGRPLEGIWYTRPSLNLSTVGGKQSIFKIIDEFAQLVEKCGGHLAGENGEGRTQSYSTHKLLDEEVTNLFTDLKLIFDPKEILNSGVKQATELRDIVKYLRSDYSSSHHDGLARF